MLAIRNALVESTLPKILIVEDDSIISLEVKATIEKLGYQVADIADSGEQAIHLAETLKPDIVLMDIALNGSLNGIDAALAIQTKSDLPIIFLTSHSDDEILRSAAAVKAHAFILKPFDEIDLNIALRLALYRGTETFQPRPENALQAHDQANSEDHIELTNKQHSDPSLSVIDSDRTLKFLMSLEIIKERSKQKLQQIAMQCSIRSLKSGEYIYQEGASDGLCFIVVSGRVALTKTSWSGRELIVELLSPGDITGGLLALQYQTNPVAAKAQTQSEILVTQKSTFSNLINGAGETLSKLDQQMLQKISTIYDRMRAMAHESVEIRVAQSLCLLCNAIASRNSAGTAVLKVTRKELSEFVGIAQETAVRVTRAMERAKLLRLPQPSYIEIVDQVGLKALIEPYN